MSTGPQSYVQFEMKGNVKVFADDELIMDKDNAIHPQNMARIIARSLSGEDNSTIYRMAFGNGASFTDIGNNTVFRAPNTGNNGGGWESRLYRETYSEVVDAGDPLYAQDPGSAGPDAVRPGGGADPNSDPTGGGVESNEAGKRSNIVITMAINENEPSGVPDPFTFDEIGLYTSGKGAIETSGSSSVDVLNKNSNDIVPNLAFLTQYSIRVVVDGTELTQLFTTPASGSGSGGLLTYGDLCEGLNTGSWFTGGDAINAVAFFFITDFTGGIYPTITGQDSAGFFTVQSKSTGANSTISFPEIISISGSPNVIYVLADSQWQRANRNTVVGEDAGAQNDPATPSNERERLLSHLIFPPISKAAGTIIRIVYTITVGVSESSTGGQLIQLTPEVSPTPSQTPAVGVTPTATPLGSLTPTPTVTASVTPSITPTISLTPTQGASPTPSPTLTQTPAPTGTPVITPTPSPTISVTPTSNVTPTVTPSPTLFIPPGTPDPNAPLFLRNYNAEIWLEHNGLVRDPVNDEQIGQWLNLYNSGFTTDYDLNGFISATDLYVLESRRLRFQNEISDTAPYENTTASLFIPRGSFECVFAFKQDRGQTPGGSGTVIADWLDSASPTDGMAITCLFGGTVVIGFYPVGGGGLQQAAFDIPDPRDQMVAVRIQRNGANLNCWYAIEPSLTNISSIVWTPSSTSTQVRDANLVRTHAGTYDIGYGKSLGRIWQGEILLVNWYDTLGTFTNPVLSFDVDRDFPSDFNGDISTINSSTGSSEVYTLKSGYDQIPAFNAGDYAILVSTDDGRMYNLGDGQSGSTQVSPSGEGWTAFVVAKSIRRSAPPGGGDREIILSDGSGTGILYLEEVSGEYAFSMNDNNVHSVGGGFSQQPVILEWANEGGTNNYTLDAYGGITGSSSYTVGGTTAFNWEGMFKIATSSVESFKGLIMEVIVLRGSSYSAGDITDIRNYLVAKYAGGAVPSPTPTVTFTPTQTPGSSPPVTPAVTPTVTPTNSPPAFGNEGFTGVDNSQTVQKFPFAAPFGTAVSAGTLPAPAFIFGIKFTAGSSSPTTGYIISGRSPTFPGGASAFNNIESFPFAAPFSSTTSLGNLSNVNAFEEHAAHQSSTDGWITGGLNPASPVTTASVRVVQSFPFAAPFLGTFAQFIGPAPGGGIWGHAGFSSPTEGFTGQAESDVGGIRDVINKFPFSSPFSDYTGHGSLGAGLYGGAGVSSSTDGYMYGAGNPFVPGSPAPNRGTIRSFPFSSPAVSNDVGALIAGRDSQSVSNVQSPTDGFALGQTTGVLTVERFPFSSPFATATDVGDLLGGAENRTHGNFS